MAIFNPIQAPFTRYATFVNNVGPTVDETLLNDDLQDGLAALYGAIWGRSYSEVGDEFEEYLHPAGKLGSLDIIANSNGLATMNTFAQGSTVQGEHGVWGILATQNAAFNFQAQGHGIGVDARDVLLSAKIKIVNRAALDTRANEGFHLGWSTRATSFPAFVAGSDSANWFTWANAVLTNTGVACSDLTWYELQIERTSGSVKFYIDGALVVTQAYAGGWINARRYVRTTSPGGVAGQGFYIDYFKRGVQR